MTTFLDMGSGRAYRLDYIKVREVAHKLNERIKKGEKVLLCEMYSLLKVPEFPFSLYEQFNTVIEITTDVIEADPKYLVIDYQSSYSD